MSETRRQDTATPAGPVGRFFEDAVSKSRFWWLLLVTGAAWIVLSIVILRFDYSTVAAVAVLFGGYCLVAAVNEVMIGALSSSTGWRIAHGLLAALLVVVGVVSFMNPGATFVSLAAVISFYFIFRGCFDIVMAFAGSAVSGVVGAVDQRTHRAGIGVLGRRVMERLRGGLGGVGGRRGAGARHRRNRPGLPDPPGTPRHHRRGTG